MAGRVHEPVEVEGRGGGGGGGGEVAPLPAEHGQGRLSQCIFSDAPEAASQQRVLASYMRTQCRSSGS